MWQRVALDTVTQSANQPPNTTPTLGTATKADFEKANDQNKLPLRSEFCGMTLISTYVANAK
jgi:hypothetical protein